jgi:CRP-like cAMP-binding protein
MARRFDLHVRQAELFTGLAPATLDMLCAAYSIRAVQDGGFFFMQSETAEHMFLLVEGRVRMGQLTEDGRRVTMRIIAAGQVFGGVSMLGPRGGYPATAEALGECIGLGWKGEQLKELARHDPGLGMKMTELMYGHLEEIQDRFRELATERVEQRVARALLRLGAPVSGKLPADIALSRQEIAEMTGTTLYTVSRLLSEWERQGIVGGGRERIVISSEPLLRAIAQETPP